MRHLLAALFVAGAAAFAPRAPAPTRPTRAFAEPKGSPPPKKGIPLALFLWPLIAVGDDIYVSQIQPRLADQGIEVPSLPYVNYKGGTDYKTK